MLGRTAAVCRPGASPTIVTEADVRDAPVIGRLDEVGAWFYEADRAVVLSLIHI